MLTNEDVSEIFSGSSGIVSAPQFLKFPAGIYWIFLGPVRDEYLGGGCGAPDKVEYFGGGWVGMLP